jgi:hypothetical protein
MTEHLLDEEVDRKDNDNVEREAVQSASDEVEHPKKELQKTRNELDVVSAELMNKVLYYSLRGSFLLCLPSCGITCLPFVGC